jgi:hypothetical protein
MKRKRGDEVRAGLQRPLQGVSFFSQRVVEATGGFLAGKECDLIYWNVSGFWRQQGGQLGDLRPGGGW